MRSNSLSGRSPSSRSVHRAIRASAHGVLIMGMMSVGAECTAGFLPRASGDAPSAPSAPPVLRPIPGEGPVPPIVADGAAAAASAPDWEQRGRGHAARIRALRHRHFGSRRAPELRAEGILQIAEFTDPAAFRPLIETLRDEADDVRLALLDHFARQGDQGQAALAWVAVTDDDPALRGEATRRMVSPVPPPVLGVLDRALRSPKHEIANNAGLLAGSLNVLEAIPLLVFSMATIDAFQGEGDLAWIAIETQRPFVSNVVPVVGDRSGAFQPVFGVVHEGIVLSVQDAVAIVYRTEVHRALVAMTTRDWGHSTAHLGYDMKAWWQWYNGTYLPFLAARDGAAAAGSPPS